MCTISQVIQMLLTINNENHEVNFCFLFYIKEKCPLSILEYLLWNDVCLIPLPWISKEYESEEFSSKHIFDGSLQPAVWDSNLFAFCTLSYTLCLTVAKKNSL